MAGGHGKTKHNQETPNPSQRGLAKVAGMDDLKSLLYDEVVSALREPEDLQAYGLTIPNGICSSGRPAAARLTSLDNWQRS